MRGKQQREEGGREEERRERLARGKTQNDNTKQAVYLFGFLLLQEMGANQVLRFKLLLQIQVGR